MIKSFLPKYVCCKDTKKKNFCPIIFRFNFPWCEISAAMFSGFYFRPKSAGISPPFSVSHFRISVVQVLFFSQSSARSMY